MNAEQHHAIAALDVLLRAITDDLDDLRITPKVGKAIKAAQNVMLDLACEALREEWRRTNDAAWNMVTKR